MADKIQKNTMEIDIESEDSMCDMTTEEMQDFFRIEARRWLCENGERLFVEKLRMIVEPERKIVKPKVINNNNNHK